MTKEYGTFRITKTRPCDCCADESETRIQERDYAMARFMRAAYDMIRAHAQLDTSLGRRAMDTVARASTEDSVTVEMFGATVTFEKTASIVDTARPR